MNRHNARILAVCAIYNLDINNKESNMISSSIEEILDSYYDEEYQAEFDKDYFISLATGVANKLKEIDEIICMNLTNYTIDRLSCVDRAILRVATYEMKYLGIAKNIIINEALEITKCYSNMEDNLQVKFNNAVLDKIGKYIYGK